MTLSFHRDADLHVYGPGMRLLGKSGPGKFPIRDWIRVKLELTRDTLKLYSADELVETVDVSAVPARKGGICFYSYGGHTARIRNIRVRVISR